MSRLTPKPYQKPWPEIRIAANSADTFPAIAKLGHGVFVAVRLGTLEELAPNIRAYREAWKEAGHPGEGQVFLRAPVYVAETAAQAREEPEESIMYFYRYLGERLEDSATRAGVRAVEDRAARGRRLQTISYDEALRDKIIVGTPEAVDRPADGPQAGARPRRHPRRDELRHQDPEPARPEIPATAVRKGQATVQLIDFEYGGPRGPRSYLSVPHAPQLARSPEAVSATE